MQRGRKSLSIALGLSLSIPLIAGGITPAIATETQSPEPSSTASEDPDNETPGDELSASTEPTEELTEIPDPVGLSPSASVVESDEALDAQVSAT